MFLWGLVAGLTAGFRSKRPWEGWLGAFCRATDLLGKIVTVFVLALIVGMTFNYFVRIPKQEAKQEQIQRCIDATPLVPVPVTYPGGPTMMVPPGTTERCENAVR